MTTPRNNTVPKSLQRANLERLVWRYTHRDSKGKRDDGTRCVLVYTNDGTSSVPLSSLTTSQLIGKIPTMHRPEGWDLAYFPEGWS